MSGRYHESIRYLVVEEKIIWDFCTLVCNTLQFGALGWRFQDVRWPAISKNSLQFKDFVDFRGLKIKKKQARVPARYFFAWDVPTKNSFRPKNYPELKTDKKLQRTVENPCTLPQCRWRNFVTNLHTRSSGSKWKRFWKTLIWIS